MPTTKHTPSGVSTTASRDQKSGTLTAKPTILRSAQRKQLRTEACATRPEVALVSVLEVEAMLGVTRNTFYPMEKRGEFPKRLTIGRKRVAYRMAEIMQWIEDTQAASFPASSSTD